MSAAERVIARALQDCKGICSQQSIDQSTVLFIFLCKGKEYLELSPARSLTPTSEILSVAKVCAILGIPFVYLYFFIYVTIYYTCVRAIATAWEE